MPAVDGIQIGRLGRKATGGLLGAEIEAPRAGDACEAFGLPIEGWALGAEGPPRTVQAVMPGRVLAAAPVDRPSPDIAARFPGVPGADRCRFRLLLNTLDLERAFAVRLRVEAADGARPKLAELRGRRRAVAPTHAPRLRPLLLTSLGRTGTTLLMRLLGEHPAVCAYRRYPSEIRGGKYWLHLFRVLAAPADPTKKLGKPSQFHEEPLAVGANPFYAAAFGAYPEVEAWSGSDYVDDLAGFALRSVDGWYGRVAAAQGQPDAAYFAEKGFPDDFPPLFHELWPGTREIFLVRDFRDMVASMIDYNRRKGVGDFSRDRYATDAAWIEGLRAAVSRLGEGWRQRQGSARLLRYEDLVADPAPILADLFAFLELPADAATVDGVLARASAETPELRAHGTSGSPAASLGRWRRDLDAETAATVERAFGGLLRDFGYPVGGDGR